MSCAGKRRFVQRLSSSGHVFYSVVLVAFMLHQIRPNLDRIKRILAKAMKHGSDRATYFNLMLEVLTRDRLSDNHILPVFQDLFNRRQLANCRNAILNTAGPCFAWNSLYFQQMLPGFRYQLSCPPLRICEGIRRVRITVSPLPGPDEDYPTTCFCLSYRLNLELA